jgi:hypothetical protein
MGGGGSQNAVVNENPLPDWAAGNVQTYLVNANALSLDDGGVFLPYSGVTYAPQTVNEILGIDVLQTATSAVHAITTKAETLIRAVMDGTYMNANSKLVAAYNARRDQMLDEFKRDTLPSIHRSFRMLGRYGGASHHMTQHIAAEKLSQAMAELAAEIFGGDYMLERSRRASVLDWGVPYGTEKIRVADYQRQVGMYSREYTQGFYNNQYDIWKAEQVAAQARLDILMNAIKACIGLSPTNTSMPFFLPKPINQIAGLALAGMSAYASIYGRAGKDPGPSMKDYMSASNQGSDDNSKTGKAPGEYSVMGGPQGGGWGAGKEER